MAGNIKQRNLASKISPPLAIIGFINIPIINLSVDWWNTLHQPASISKLSAPSIDVSMLIPLFIMTAACFLFLLTVSLIRFRLVLIENKMLRTSSL
jgi:ABC-type transport system involved in cytochrome c biogenesis, permease component